MTCGHTCPTPSLTFGLHRARNLLILRSTSDALVVSSAFPRPSPRKPGLAALVTSRNSPEMNLLCLIFHSTLNIRSSQSRQLGMPLDCLVAPRAARSLVTQSPRITSIASRARPFTMPTSPAATASCAPSQEPTFSPGSDTSLLAKDTESLLAGGWQLDHERMGLTKTYFFKTYTKVQVEQPAVPLIARF